LTLASHAGVSFNIQKWDDGMEPETAASILVADDALDWRVRIRSLVQERPEWLVSAEVCDGLLAVEKATELHPDIVLLDIGMPILNGIQAAKRIRQASPGSRIIFVTQENDEDVRLSALAVGAEGYLLKANAATELLPAIDAALWNGHALR
jgi:DNA-binding NarL/FixJ family response regulator